MLDSEPLSGPRIASTQAPRSGQAVLLLLLVALISLPSLPTRELMPTDEPRFALVARQMVEDPAPLVPHLGYDPLTRQGEVYADKPPMFFWLISLFSFFTGGVNEISARLPSFVAAAAAVLLTWRIGELLVDAPTGFLAAAILAATSQFFVRSSWCSIDMTLTGLVLAATYCWLRTARAGHQGEVVGTPSSNSRYRTFALSGLGGLFAALATLSKGPVGLIYPAAYLGCDRAVARLSRGRERPSPRSLLRGHPSTSAVAAALAFLVPVGAWILAIYFVGGRTYTIEILFKQNVTRYVAAWNNVAPWYYYFYRLPLGLLPWTLLLPGAVIAARGLPGPSAQAVRGLLLSTTVLLVFFSISTGKRGVYILPLYPAIAILIAVAWRRRDSRPQRIIAAIHVAVFLVAGVLAPFVLPRLAAGRLEGLGPGVWPLVLIITGTSILATILYYRGRPDSSLAAQVCGVAALVFAGSILLVPLANRSAGVREFGAQLAAVVPSGDFLLVDQEGYEQILFYSRLKGARIDFTEKRVETEDGRVVLTPRALGQKPAGTNDSAPAPSSGDALADDIARSRLRVVFPQDARVVFVIKKERADRLRAALGPTARTLLAGKLYGKPYFVIASR